MLRHLPAPPQSSSKSQWAYWTLRMWEPDWKRCWSADSAGSRPASWQWLAMAPPTVPKRAPFFPPPYRSQRVQLRLSCQVAVGVRSHNGEVVSDHITKNILLLVQRNQIFCPDLTFFARIRPAPSLSKSHSACSFPLQLFCWFTPVVVLLPVGGIAQ